MLSTLKRINDRANSFADNVKLLAPLMGNPLRAALYILNSRGQSYSEASAKFGQCSFIFRRCDISAVKEIFQAGEYNFLSNIMKTKKKPVVFDLGAHIGLFSIWCLNQNSNAIVKSIEASPNTFDILKKNAQNQKEANWTVQNNAAWKNNDAIKFSDDLESSMSHKVNEDGNIEVVGLTFNDILNLIPSNQNIDILKIDIEGAEEAFLCGTDINFDRINNLVIELHPNLCETSEIEHMLKRSFSKVIEKHDKTLSKPLLFCQK